MRTIGIRVSPSVVTFAVYDTNENKIINIEKIKIPKALSFPDALKYIRNNILDILREYEIENAGIRVTESNSQHLNIKRISIESVLQESFASSALDKYYCGQISNISFLIGIERKNFKLIVDGNQKYLDIENWDNMSKEEREAILTAIGAENA